MQQAFHAVPEQSGDDDATLLARLQEGEEEAFAILGTVNKPVFL